MWISAREVREFYGITSQTLYNWRNKNNIVFKRLPSGKIVYDVSETKQENTRKNVLYARVSNTKQKEDLVRQISVISNYMASSGIIVDSVYEDIASGMNENRKSFNTLIDDVCDGKINTIYISYKDRLTRFGFDYFVKLFSKYDTKIVILNSTKEEDFQTELTQDLVSIIHHFSMKMYSNRRKHIKKFEESLNSIED